MENHDLCERTITNLSNMVAQQAQQIAALQSFIQGMVVEEKPQDTEPAEPIAE